MKKYRIIIVALIVFNFVLLGYLVYRSTSSEKFAYINIQKVFHEFDYKVELERKLIVERDSKEKILDSLLTNLRSLANHLESIKKPSDHEIAEFRQRQTEFQQRKKAIDEQNQALADAYDKQILEQMNQYIIDFGKTKNYKYIFGSDGKGNIMYAEETEEVTNDVIAFINKKFKGLN